MSLRFSSLSSHAGALTALCSLRSLCGATALASGVALALGVPGCTDKTNAEPDTAGPFEGGSGAPSSAASDCTTCTVQECTGPWSVCLTDSRCVALRGCNNPFGESEAARAQCFCDVADASDATPDSGAEPLAAYAAFAACSDARTCGACASDCTSSCSAGAPNRTTTTTSCASADAAPPVTPVMASVEACASCVAGRCGDATKACALGTECSVFLACAYACAAPSCVDACGTAHSTGKASATELSSCTLTSCRSACGL